LTLRSFSNSSILSFPKPDVATPLIVYDYDIRYRKERILISSSFLCSFVHWLENAVSVVLLICYYYVYGGEEADDDDDF
jgi:hypothetical protein